MKTVVLLGAGGLLGKAFADYLLESEYQLALVDVNAHLLESLDKQFTGQYQGQYRLYQVDATDTDQVEKLVKDSSRDFGRIDALVNNIYPRNSDYGKALFEVTYQSFCDNVSMNLGGYFLSSQKFSQYFIDNGGGSIVNIASIYGSVAPKFEIYQDTQMTMPVEYSAIKSAVIHLTKYFARFLAGKNVRVNCLSPGGINDSQPHEFLQAYRDKTLNKGMLDAKDLCGSLRFLLSDESTYINGQNLIVDDGFTL